MRYRLLTLLVITAIISAGCVNSVSGEPIEIEPSVIGRPCQSDIPITPSEGETLLPETTVKVLVTTETTAETTTAITTTTAAVTTKKPITYKKINKFYNKTLLEAEKIFGDSGLRITVEYDYNSSGKDIVYKFMYYGYEKDDAYYIDSESTTTLLVSLGPQQSNATVAADSKIVYLTFDDGPHSSGTEKVLEVLKKHNAKATFFLVGYYMDAYPDKVRKIYSAGHSIGCHSTNHEYREIYASPDTLQNNILEWENSLRRIIGSDLPYKLFRYPGGTTNAYIEDDVYSALLKRVYDIGYLPFDWTVVDNDSLVKSTMSDKEADAFVKDAFVNTFETCERYAKNPKIVLLHDTKSATCNALDWMLTYLEEKGYVFGTLDELDKGWVFKY